MAWKEIKASNGNGSTGSRYIKASQLSPGEVAVEGVYKERTPSNFSEPDNPKFDHVFQLGDGGIKVVNSSSDLDRKLDLVELGTMVRVTYVGKEQVKGKKGIFTKHIFRVEGEEESDAGSPF